MLHLGFPGFQEVPRFKVFLAPANFKRNGFFTLSGLLAHVFYLGLPGFQETPCLHVLYSNVMPTCVRPWVPPGGPRGPAGPATKFSMHLRALWRPPLEVRSVGLFACRFSSQVAICVWGRLGASLLTITTKV